MNCVQLGDMFLIVEGFHRDPFFSCVETGIYAHDGVVVVVTPDAGGDSACMRAVDRVLGFLRDHGYKAAMRLDGAGTVWFSIDTRSESERAGEVIG